MRADAARGGAPNPAAGQILVVNAGSTSLKLHLVDAAERSRPVAALDDPALAGVRIGAVAHRVVHGGPRFREPVLIDERVAEQIFALEPLAPLHNAPALRAIEEAQQAFPDVPHVAVFDTGFHHTIPPEAAVYPIPKQWREWGVHRYGFHGLSVAWCAERVPELLGRPAQGLRLVVCHLGGGCSVSAVHDGRSVDTTMGFSPLEGVPMATRSGSIDPGALVYAMRERGLSVEEVEHALNFDSGLHGLTGAGTEKAGDVAAIERRALAGDGAARLAIDLFCHRLAGAVSAMAASLGGIDALAFTAGIGEGSALVRAEVCRRLSFLGMELDQERNGTGASDRPVSVPGSPLDVLVIAAKEEIVAARGARELLGGQATAL